MKLNNIDSFISLSSKEAIAASLFLKNQITYEKFKEVAGLKSSDRIEIQRREAILRGPAYLMAD